MSQHSTEQIVITGSSYFTKGSGAIAVIGGASQKAAESAADVMSFADMGVVFGMAGVALGLLVNSVALWRRDKREKELHAIRVNTLKTHGNLPSEYNEPE